MSGGKCENNNIEDEMGVAEPLLQYSLIFDVGILMKYLFNELFEWMIYKHFPNFYHTF